MNLYTLTQHQRFIQNHLELSGFDAQTIIDTLDGESNTDALKEKRLGYIAIIKSKRAMAAAREKPYLDMGELIKADLDAANRLEAALFSSMQATNDIDLVGLEFEAHIKGKAAALVIKEGAVIPAEFMVTPEPSPPVARPDKDAIKKELAAGRVIDGCELGTNKKLVIK